MKKLIFTLLILMFSKAVFSQNADFALKFKFKSFHLFDPKLKDINFYVDTIGLQEKKPVLLYLDGSGSNPLFMKMKQGVGSTIPFISKEIRENFHLVVISKPGVLFIDSVKTDGPFVGTEFPPSKTYTTLLSYDWRLESANMVLDFLVKQPFVDKSKVVVWGISEGAQIVPELAVKNKNVTHVVGFVGNALSQFYDFILFARAKILRGSVNPEDGQREVDELLKTYQDIMANPTATDKEWMGHSYLRWASFCRHTPSDYLLKLNIPIYWVSSGQDENSATLNNDYLPVAFILQQKNNLTYKCYPNYDHSFNENVKQDGKIIKVDRHLNDVINEAVVWLNKK